MCSYWAKSMTLTIKQAEKAKPKGKKYSLSAGKSLFLVISPAGGKHWKYRYRINGKSAEYTLKGSFPDLSIKEALEQVDILRKLVRQGVHPIAQEMREKLLNIVPLSNQAIGTLKAQQEFSSHSNYIFPQQNYPHKVMSENTLLKVLERMGYRGRMTGHGFRHIASTKLNEMGFRSDLIEKQLAHGDKDHVRATYNKAQYLPERAEMMQSWADFIDGLRLSNNVATIRRMT